MTEKNFHNSDDDNGRPVVLIAGGAGFIGSFLCELLLQQDCRVICLDDLSTGTKENLNQCSAHPHFSLVKHNLSQPLDVKIDKPDYIFHLAGLEPYISGADFSLETLLANIAGTIHLLKLAEKSEAKFLLGSSPRVFQAEIPTEKLKEYFGKGPKAEIASFAEAKRSAEALVTEFMEKNQVDVRIVRLNWVYGPRMDLRTGGILAQLIKEAAEGGPLGIPGDGSQKIQPTFVSDVVYGLSKAMFSSGTAGKIYSLINPNEATLLVIAHQLQGLMGQNLTIEYVAEEERPVFQPKAAFISDEQLGWQPKIDLNQGLKQTLEYFQKRIKKTPPKPPTIKEKKKKKETKTKKKPFFSKTKKIIVVSFFIILFTLLALPAIFTINLLLGVNNLNSAYRNALAGNFNKTVSAGSSAKRDFQRAQENLHILGPVFRLTKQDSFQNKIETFLVIGLQTGRGMEKLGEVAKDVNQISQAVFQDEPAEIELLTEEIGANLDLVYQEFSYLEGQLKAKPEARQLFIRFDEKLLSNLSQVREIVLQAKEAVLLLPELTGVYEKKTYLVLLQNNMELRPTGGFIGSFALVTFADGKLIDFQVTDVYSSDGQLKGHVEPPEPIKEHLGEAGWYLRDSNFSPDFPVSAQRASWFLEKEMGRRVDGVIGIDLFLAQKILRAVGPVNLPDYQEEINADNLFERAEYHAEVNFFPGSTQKKDFLGTLANTLFEKMKQAEDKQWLIMGQAIFQSLKAKDLLIYLNNQEAARILADSGWDGGVRNIQCQIEEKCLIDYLMIVESNFGVNKANYFVKRGLTHQVSIDSKGQIEAILRIDYHNQSQSEIFPAGKYKNYLRILTPRDTKLKKVLVDGKELGEDKIDQEEIKNKNSFGFLVNVPIQERKTIEISYQLADKLTLEKGSHYLLYLQKQPGIEDEAFDFWLVPPLGLSASSTKPESSITDEFVVFSQKFNQDLVFEVVF